MADSPLAGIRRCVLRRPGERGSLLVEMIFILPALILIWTLLHYTWQAKRQAVVEQREARECAWQHAYSGCEDTPDECTTSGDGRIGDILMHVIAEGNFLIASYYAPWIAPNVAYLHGEMFIAKTEMEIERHPVLGGTTLATGRMKTACGDEPEVKWTTWPVFFLMCFYYNSTWCGG